MSGKTSEQLVRWFEASESSSNNNRLLVEKDVDFYDGKQWTTEQVTALNKRGQAAVVINRVKRKIDDLIGIEKLQRTDPKAFPRNPDDEDAAEAATDSIRFVTDNVSYDTLRSEWWEDLLKAGYGGCRWDIDFDKGDQAQIVVNIVHWDRLFWDAASREKDFSDAKYKGIVIWMDHEDALEKWPNGKDILSAVRSSTTSGNTYDDKPKNEVWVSEDRKRVKVCEIHYQEPDGVWWIDTFTWGGILESKPSPFLDEDDNTYSPLNIEAAFVDRENNRYGAIRELISIQEEINKRRSKGLHHISARQVRVSPGGAAHERQREVRAELAKPDGVVEADKDEFEILPTNDMAAGNLSLMQEAKSEIDFTGVNPSLAGRERRALSGRALQTQQQGGMVGLAGLMDRKRSWDVRNYRMIWLLVQQFWTEERWIRVTDDQKNMRFVGLNKPVTVGDAVQQTIGKLPPEDQAPAAQIALETIPPGAMNDVVDIENNVGELDVDIVIDESPDVVTLQAEEFAKLVELVTAGMQIPPDVLIEASNLKNKDVILERMRGDDSPEAKEEAQAVKDLALRDALAEIAGKEADAAESGASAFEKQTKGAKNLQEIEQGRLL